MKTLSLFLVPFFMLFTGSKPATEAASRPATVVAGGCAIPNTAFQAGEKVGFTVGYSVAGAFVPAGSGSFVITSIKWNGRSVYHITGTGRTLSSYEWAYKANDTYETFIDVETFQPLQFVRNINEGGYKKYQKVSFDKTANTAITNEGVFPVPPCVHDVVSSVFYARNVDYNSLKPGDKVPFSVFLDNEVFNMYIRYMGKETINTKYGKFKTIRIQPLTIKGTIFEGGEKMVVWVTDDANRVPVRVESPIIVGKVRIDMTSFQGLKNPMTALIKKH
ncbi:DUF3108 domain-containing protein [Niabella drilacis]|uniref:DUF3108 domain-containing protein n=1 Tax=Niabella drilacis (strain DSM 25811 / CCM 8410 / CCUG 62505 / LMG 26954 / E90) TaxID=1285928 RepID=A0A1G6YPD2_NIADE|nr:DUF3108 domain-containing protein [Niabella drilacis]SDD92181.1 Protein of unknown function [Niabella drilacis]